MTIRWADGPDVLACGCVRGMGVPGLCTEGRRLWAVMQAARHEAVIDRSLAAQGAVIAAQRALANHVLAPQTPIPPLLAGLTPQQRLRLRVERWRYVHRRLHEGGHSHERAHLADHLLGFAAIQAIVWTLAYLAARAI